MDKREAIEFLKQCLGEIPQLAKLDFHNQGYPLWRRKIRDVLEAVFGRHSSEYQDFSRCNWQAGMQRMRIAESLYQEGYLTNLKCIETALLSIIQKYEILGFETKSATSELPPKAFIAHEGETRALGKLKTFLDSLGVKYLIAEIEPSNGRLVEPQVTWTYGNADFAIILATKGGVIDKKKDVHYMGINVADELGRAREVFKNRIILLLETGVQPHTNISGIVYERFKPQSMDKAFIKIAKELRNWGFMRAGKIEEQT